jgi:SAM-dependent methyltransferase
MEAIARKKSAHRPNRRFIKADILQVFEHEVGPFDAVISSYTVHHLTEAEKGALFAKIFTSLVPGGRAVFGDLMVQNSEARALKIQAYVASGDTKTAQDIKEEFFWLIDAAVADLSQLGFLVKTRRFSDFSYGIVAEKMN